MEDKTMPTTRTCAECGKVVTQGYVWDNITTFCSKTCAARALDNDTGAVDILMDDGRITTF